MDLLPEVTSLVEGALDATVILDRDLGIVCFNQTYLDLTGLRRRDLSRGTLHGLCHENFGLTCCSDEQGCIAKRAFEKGSLMRENEVVATRKDLRFIVSAYPLKNQNGDVYAVFEQYRDVTAENRVQMEYKRLYEEEQAKALRLNTELNEASQAARTDGLTGLINRRYYDIELARLLADARTRQLPLSLILFDLDFFKRVNDQFGHQAGDVVLQEFAQALKRTARDGDLVARVGGEEFVLVLPSAGPEQALMVAARVAERMRQMQFVTTASGGIACYPTDGSTAAELYRMADGALYTAKHAGRNRVLLASPALVEVAAVGQACV